MLAPPFKNNHFSASSYETAKKMIIIGDIPIKIPTVTAKTISKVSLMPPFFI